MKSPGGLFPSCLEAMPTQVLRIAPEHSGEDNWNVLQESTLSLLSILVTVWVSREIQRGWCEQAASLPEGRQTNTHSQLLMLWLTMQEAKVFVFPLSPHRLACSSVLVSADLAASWWWQQGWRRWRGPLGLCREQLWLLVIKGGYGKSDGPHELDAVVI